MSTPLSSSEGLSNFGAVPFLFPSVGWSFVSTKSATLKEESEGIFFLSGQNNRFPRVTISPSATSSGPVCVIRYRWGKRHKAAAKAVLFFRNKRVVGWCLISNFGRLTLIGGERPYGTQQFLLPDRIKKKKTEHVCSSLLGKQSFGGPPQGSPSSCRAPSSLTMHGPALLLANKRNTTHISLHPAGGC